MEKIISALSEESLQKLNSFVVPDLNKEVEEKFCLDWGLRYALLQNSGTSALFSCYYSCGLSRGSEVLVQSYGFFATAMPLFFLGCKIVFVDSDANGNISIEDLKKKVNGKTKAIVITHLWGIPCEMIEIMKVVRENNLILIEDCSHAHGAKYQGIVVGNFGSASAWSLGAKKNITGGQGGLFATKSRLFYERAYLLGAANDKAMKNIKLQEHQPYIITGMGLNLRIHPFSAFMIKLQQKNYETEVLPKKREIAKLLRTELSDIEGLSLPYIPENSDPAWYAFPVLFDKNCFSIDKKGFIATINENYGQEVVDAPYSTCPISSYPVFRDQNICPGAISYHEKVFKFAVPSCDDRMMKILRIIESIKKAVNIYRR